MKKATLMVLGTAMQTYGEQLPNQQEVLSLAADMLIDVFAAESSLLRAIGSGQPLADTTARIVVDRAAARAEVAARTALAAMTDGDNRRTLLAALRRFLKITPADTVTLRRQVADAVMERCGYPF